MNSELNKGIFANPFFPFLTLLVVTAITIAVSACWSLNSSISLTLTAKAEALTKSLGAVLADPLAMGEYDHVQRVLDATRQADPDVIYMIVSMPDGRVVAATDRALKNLSMTRTAFEKEALKVEAYVVRATPFNNVFETDIPIFSGPNIGGFLRIGTTTLRAEEAVHRVLILLATIATASIIMAALLFSSLARNAQPARTAPPADG